MAEYDLVIRGGTIVDGTGVPRFRGDLAIKDGRVAKVSGNINSGGAKEIDASGCIVAPGAVDLHTHYDAQLNWDPYATLSGWFGVTSLTIGECGFGFAPTKPEDRDLNMRMMNRIEAIPLGSMEKGMRWDWETFPEYMDSLERQGLGVNVGPMFPFSPMRGYVLGMTEARERTSVTDAELARMVQIFDESMKAGAFGFSFNKNMEDRPEDGTFLPSHVASDREFVAMGEVLAKYGVGHIGLTLGFGLSRDERDSVRELTEELMKVSGRPFSLLDVEAGEAADWSDSCLQQGLPLMAQEICTPAGIQFKLSEFNLFDYMPNWVQPFVGTAAERMEKLSDPETRAVMKKDIDDWPNFRTDWKGVQAIEVVNDRNIQYEGMPMSELAELQGKDPLDAFLDLAIDEGLETEFWMAPANITEDTGDLSGQGRSSADKLKNPHAHISVSDGGAHTRFTVLSPWPVYWLSHWIRDKELMSLEDGHRKISALPAWLADFKERGTLRVGNWADIMIYNQDELGMLYEKSIFATDFPGGERRLIQKPTGMRFIIVNGTVTFENNECTGALPGKLLRSYDMVD